MGQQPSKGGAPTTTRTPTKQSDRLLLEQVYAQQERQRLAHQKQQEKAKQLNSQHESELQRSVRSARHEETPLTILSKSTGFSLILLRRLEVLFQIISGAIIRDNMIDPDELSNALGLSQNSILFLALFKLFDATQTHRVNFRTWIMTLYNLSPQASFHEKCRFSFSLLDLNGDGTIEREELVNLVKNVISLAQNDGQHGDISDINEDDIRQIVDQALLQADVNGDGEISYDEYQQMMLKSKLFYTAFTIDLDHLCAAFTSPEVQQAVLLTQDEALRRTKQFQAKKYQHVIRDSFTAHVVPMMYRLSISRTDSEAQQQFQRDNDSTLSQPGIPECETLDQTQWDNFQSRTLQNSVLNPNHPNNTNNIKHPTTPTDGQSGTMADLVRMRSMSGMKQTAIIPASYTHTNNTNDNSPDTYDEWQLIDEERLLELQRQQSQQSQNQNNNNKSNSSNNNNNKSNNTSGNGQKKDTSPNSGPNTPHNNNTTSPRLDLNKVPTTTTNTTTAPTAGSGQTLAQQRFFQHHQQLQKQQTLQQEQEQQQQQQTLSLPITPSSTISEESNISPDGIILTPSTIDPFFRDATSFGPSKPLPRISLSRNSLERKLSLTTPNTPTSPNDKNNTNFPQPSPRLSQAGYIEVSSPTHGRIVRERSEKSVFSNVKDNDNDTDNNNNRNGNSPPSGHIRKSSTGGLPPQHLSQSHHNSPQQQQQKQHLPPQPLLLPSPSVHILPSPSSDLLDDLQTISEDASITILPTPPGQIRQLDTNIVTHYLIYSDNTTVPILIITEDLTLLDIEVEEEEGAFAMESNTAPALARLLAALREDNPWQ